MALTAIEKIYVSRCEARAKNTNDIPKKYRDNVIAQIYADGFRIDEDGWCYPVPITETSDVDESATI